LFKRLVTLAGKLSDFCFRAGPRETARLFSLSRIAALRHFRLAASRVSRVAACFGAPSHRPPKAQDYAIMADYIRDLRPAKWGLLKKS
jgi:hypothetical protein